MLHEYFGFPSLFMSQRKKEEELSDILEHSWGCYCSNLLVLPRTLLQLFAFLDFEKYAQKIVGILSTIKNVNPLNEVR